MNQDKGKENRGQAEGRGQIARRGGSGLAQRGLSPWLSLRPTDFWNMNPWELMRRFSEDVDRMFEGGTSQEALGYVPPLESFQRGNELVVRAELPGVPEKDVKVEVTGEGLLIEGERHRDFEDKGEGFYRSERSYGRFQRLVPLPAEADAEKARATFKDGVLEVSVPMPESRTRRRQVPIGTETGKEEGELVGAGTSKAGSTR